jgi:hypothetical protein
MTTTAHPSYLDFFSETPKNFDVENGFVSKILPLTSVASNNSVIEFLVPSLSQCLISPSDTQYVIRLKITASDGKDLAEIAAEKADAFFTILNSAASSIISDMQILINGQHVGSSNSLYPFVGHVHNLLSNITEKRYEFLSRGFLEEAADDGKTVNSSPGVLRYGLVNTSKEAVFIGGICNGIFQEKQLLAPNVTLGVRMFPSKSSFFIFSKNTTYKVEIISAHLEVKYLKLDSQLLIKTIERMKIQPYLLHHLNIKPKNIVLSSGISTITLPNILTGVMPVKLLFTFISNKSLLGTYDTNPLNFQPYTLSSYMIKINEKNYPSNRLNYSFAANGNYIELYNHVMKNLAESGSTSTGIGSKFFASGGFFVIENLLHDAGNPFVSPPQSGSMTLELEFSTSLTEAVSLILLPVYASTLSIDVHGNVSLQE